ncbi:MAG TPA: class I SAM-dependent methyltransferase [Acidimicrobiales bacterium]|nr:class I SAM-dependent methyltransferase [Acidimicrobiales bacterium]
MTSSPEHHGHDQGTHGAGATWDERYAAGEWPTDPDPLLVELTGTLSPGRAIDLGCGTGRNAVWLATAGWKVTGVDGSSVGLAQAGQRATEAGTSLDTVQADLAGYRPDPGAYDLVVVANIHLPADERGHLFAAAAEALAPGGHLYVVGHHLESLGLAGPPDPDRLYTEELLGEAFGELEAVRLGRTGHGDTAERSTAGDVYLWAVRPA